MARARSADDRFGEAAEQQPLHPRRSDVVTYRVRVDLLGIRPPVWRRLDLASDLPLDALHRVLPAAIGWTDSHLHRFSTGADAFTPGAREFASALDVEEGEDENLTLEVDVRLDEVLAGVADRLHYTYDFGDGWRHVVEVEEVIPREAGAPPAVVVTGRRAGPPEDVGGPWGYAQLLELAAAARFGTELDEDDAERLEWAGPLAPEAFDAAEVQEAVSAALEPLDLTGLAGPVVDLVLRATGPGNRAVDELLHRARLSSDRQEELDDAAVTSAVLPWQRLLELVGPDGTPLTAAGYLKPDVVVALRQVVDLHHDWIGKGNREDLTVPVAAFRAGAQALGLVRRYRGRLVLTPAAHRAAGDPRALLLHLLQRLPLGASQAERDAGMLALLALAGGRSPLTEAEEALGAGMDALSWAVDDASVRGSPLRWAARPTTDALRHLGALVRGRGSLLRHEDVVGPHGPGLARRALREWPSP